MAKTSKPSLAESHPELAAQADGWDPALVTQGSNKRLSWKCGHGHSWFVKPNDRTKGSGCPICSNKKVQAGYNDLATTNPELARQADGWDPTTLTAHSGKKVGWRCELRETDVRFAPVVEYWLVTTIWQRQTPNSLHKQTGGTQQLFPLVHT
jgi:hypothetical protein